MRSILVVLAMALALAAVPGVVHAQPNPCVNVNLHPNNTNLPGANLGVPYAALLWVTPNNPCIPIIWTVAPSLPPGLSLTVTGPNQAVIAGIPTAIGTYTFTVTAQCTYVCGTVCFLSKTYTLVVT